MPCYLTISCDDVGALNLLADPRTPRVRLRRSTRAVTNQPLDLSAEHFRGRSVPEPSHTPLWLAHREGNRAKRLSTQNLNPDIEPFVVAAEDEEQAEEILGPSEEISGQEIGRVAWCTPANITQEPHVRTQYGEIRLPRELQPTCKFPLFNILVSESLPGMAGQRLMKGSPFDTQYHVELLSPATNAFIPDLEAKPLPHKEKTKEPVEEEGQGEHVYISRSVEITTNPRRDEPIPIPFVWVADGVTAAPNRVESSSGVLESLWASTAAL